MKKTEENYDEKPLYGHYHCKKCGCELKPIQRISWVVSNGVQSAHHCPKCKTFMYEKEYGDNEWPKSEVKKINIEDIAHYVFITVMIGLVIFMLAGVILNFKSCIKTEQTEQLFVGSEITDKNMVNTCNMQGGTYVKYYGFEPICVPKITVK